MTERRKKFSRDKESKITAIVDASVELINEKGPTGFSINELPGKAGLSIGTVYRYFPRGKPDIILEILRRNMAWFIEIAEESEKAASIDEVWAVIIRAFIGVKRENLTTEALLIESAPVGSPLYEELAPMIMEFYGRIHGALSRFAAFGGIPEEQARLRIGLSFSLMRTAVRGQAMYPLFRSDEELEEYLLRLVKAAFPSTPQE